MEEGNTSQVGNSLYSGGGISTYVLHVGNFLLLQRTAVPTDAMRDNRSACRSNGVVRF